MRVSIGWIIMGTLLGVTVLGAVSVQNTRGVAVKGVSDGMRRSIFNAISYRHVLRRPTIRMRQGVNRASSRAGYSKWLAPYPNGLELFVKLPQVLRQPEPRR